MYPFGRALSVGPIEVSRLELEGGDAELAKAVLAKAWARLGPEARRKLERLDGDLKIPWAVGSTSAGTTAEAIEELSKRVAETIETWIDEVLTGEEFRREKKTGTKWSPEILIDVVEEVATRPPHAIAELGEVVKEVVALRFNGQLQDPPQSLVKTAARVLARGREPVLDVLEAKALEMQGLTPEASLEAIDHFDSTKQRFFHGAEYGFQFGSPERHIYGLESGLPPSPNGFLGPGIYFGTTPTPGWFLKHMGFVGWGIGPSPSRTPINLDKHRAFVRYSMFGSVPEESERKAGVEYKKIRFNPLVPQAGVIAVTHHLKLV